MPFEAAIRVVWFGGKWPGASASVVTWCVPVPAYRDGMLVSIIQAEPQNGVTND
jgi:hypothetical protein